MFTKKTSVRLGAAVLSLSLVAAACGDDDESVVDQVEDAAGDAVQEVEDAAGEAVDAAEGAVDEVEEAAGDAIDEVEDAVGDPVGEDPGTIPEVAADAGDFTTLVAAVEAAGLAETLSGEGPFTVFAPTDAAFEAALADLGLTADELLADTETLTSILTYHVVEGEVPSSEVVTLDGQSVATVNGAEVTISVDGETVMVNDATVTAVDVEASNGVIHVIDSVLLPPSE